MSERPAQSTDPKRREEAAEAHWRANRRAMALLLVVWFAVPFLLGIVFVEPLNQFHLGGFPLGFWFAQQGSIYVFVVLIAIYALWMERIDRDHAPPAEPSERDTEDDRA